MCARQGHSCAALDLSGGEGKLRCARGRVRMQAPVPVCVRGDARGSQARLRAGLVSADVGPVQRLPAKGASGRVPPASTRVCRGSG